MDNLEQKKVVKPAAKKPSTAALRVSLELRKKIVSDLMKLNKKAFGKRVRADAYIVRAIAKLTADDFVELQSQSLTNQDRLEQAYREYVAKNGTISKDEYLGKILAGEVTNSPQTNVTFSERKGTT